MKILQSMKRRMIYLTAVALFFLLIFPQSALAVTNYSAGENVLLAKEEIVNSDYFAAGNSVIISGTINGDVYAAGANVLVDGTVNGDVLVAGGNVTIGGIVNGNIRAAGGQVLVTGDVQRNVTSVGGNITINTPNSIRGSLVAAGGTISLLSRIEQNATLAGGQIALTKDATIMGQLNYWSDTPAQITYPQRVNGGISYHQTQMKQQQKVQQKKAEAAPFFVVWSVAWVVVSFILGALLLRFLPAYTQQVADKIKQQPWASLGIGFLCTLLFPMLFVILLITLVGIPFALIALLTFIVMTFFTPIFIALLIGEKILPTHKYWGLLVGVVAWSIINVIPVVNFLVGMIVFFITLGAMLLTKKEIYTRLRKENAI